MAERGKLLEQIRAEAADWAVRAHASDFGDAERAALNAWRRLSPEHDAMFVRALHTWNDATLLGHRTFKERRSGVDALRRIRGLAVAAIAIAVIAVGLFADDWGTLLRADHATAPGEVRTIELSDGSTVLLNTRTALAERFGGGARRVALLAGEAAFDVRSQLDDGRPFLVDVLGGEVRAMGTRFLVARHGDRADVTVLEHRVRVSFPTAGTSGDSVILAPGQAIDLHAAGRLGSVRSANVAHATAWQRGLLVFDRQPLAAVIADLNRYRRERIVVAGDRLRRKEVSGVFRIDALDDAVDRIADELGARALRLPPLVTVLY